MSMLKLFLSLFRWISECPAQAKCCPTCKRKATPRDIRQLYAKKVVVADKLEEDRLNQCLKDEKAKNDSLQFSLSKLRSEMSVLKQEYFNLEMQLNSRAGTFQDSSHVNRSETIYKLSLHRNIEISREGGCRSLIYSRHMKTIIASQKSSVTLFPGFGVRCISAHNFQPTAFFRIATKSIRELSLDTDEHLLAAAAMEKSAYIFDTRTHVQVATVTPSSDDISSTSFDKFNSKYLIVGSNQRGITYLYDIRNSSTYVEQYEVDDRTQVFGITSIEPSTEFPCGGFIVMKSKSLWFYEHTNSHQIQQTKLHVEGLFVSINYDEKSKLLVVATKPSSNYRHTRYIIGKLKKTNLVTEFRVSIEIQGSTVKPELLSRCTQINTLTDTILAAYVQDTKLLSTWNSNTGKQFKGFGVDDCILDMCPMYLNNQSYLATLSDTKCRIFQLNAIIDGKI